MIVITLLITAIIIMTIDHIVNNKRLIIMMASL